MLESAATVSREQRRAILVIGGLLLVSFFAWFVLGLVTSDPEPREPSVLGGPAPSSPPPRAGEEPAADADADGADEADQTDDADDADGTEAAQDDAGDEPADVATDRVTIDFDGVCSVEVDPDEQTTSPRPWHFEDCARAPIELRGTQTRWIVVLDSLAASDFTEAEALDRASDDQQVLWSSHYPSLNPDIWVVADGPFDDRDAAIEAAERLGGGAYARELSDDEGDRYCVAADGCVGETRD
jgi:hypothetical protein